MNEHAALEQAVTSGRISAAEAQAALAQGTVASLLQRLGASEQIGPYELIRELARGGMGAVYVARRPGLDRQVALKLLHGGAQADEDLIERFRREARVSARLRHPNIVAIHDVGQDRANHYLVMDLIEGESLAQRLKRQGPLEPRVGAALGQSLAEALAYAHRNAVLHRDLKPHNVLLDAAGQAYLTDFGLAKDVEGGVSITQSGAVMGTPAYMPPEQAEGEVDLVDRRSDVYGLGATLYHALTGQAPFSGASAIQILNAVVTAEPPVPRALRPDFPRDLETILLTALAKDPAERYVSAQALAEDLGRFLAGHPIQARPPSIADRASKWLGRNRALGSFALVGLFLLLLAPLGARVWASQAKEGARADLARATRADFAAAIASVGSGAEEADLVSAQDALLASERWHALDPQDAEAQAGMSDALERVVGIVLARREWSQAVRVIGTAAQRRGLEETVVRLRAKLATAQTQSLAEDRAAIDAATRSTFTRSERNRLGLTLAQGASRARVELFARELQRISDVAARISREQVRPEGEAEVIARWLDSTSQLSPRDRSLITEDPGFLGRAQAIEAALASELPGLPLTRARFLCELLGSSAHVYPEAAIQALARFTRLAWSQESASIGFTALAQCGIEAGRSSFLEAYRLLDGSWATRTTARQFADAFSSGSEIYEVGASSDELLAQAQRAIEAGLRDRRQALNGIALAQAARDMYPDSLRALSLVIESWSVAGVPEAGRAAAQRAEGLAPNSSRVALQSSVTRGEDALGSLHDLDRALALDPTNWHALRTRASTNLLVGHLLEAIEDAARLCREVPTEPAAPALLACALMEQGRLPEAHSILQGAIRRWPTSRRLHRALARILANRGDRPGTEAALRQAGPWTFAPFVRWLLSRDPEQLFALVTAEFLASLEAHEAGLAMERRANLEASAEQVESALGSVSLVLRARPQLSRAFILRGQLRTRQQRLAEAAIDYSRVLAREPERDRLRLKRLELALRLRAAEMVLQDATILTRSRSLPAASRGRAALHGALTALSLERFELAQALARAALQCQPNLSEGHRVLAEVAEERGAKAEALEHYRRFLAQAPPNHPHRGKAEARVRALGGR